MDPPFGHHHHRRHHHQNPDEELETPPPFPPPYHQQPPFSEQPPPFYQPIQYPPPYHPPDPYLPPPESVTVTHVSHHSPSEPPLYPYGRAPDDYSRRPPPSHPFESDHPHVTHVWHEPNRGPYDRPEFAEPGPYSHRHHLPNLGELCRKPTVKVYCKADPDYHLTIRDDKVVLAPADPSDEFQHWYRDEKHSTRVKDEEGCPCFALVNKATGLAMKHADGDTHPIQLIPYDPDRLDMSILWTQSKDMGDGYRALRMVNNIRLNVDAFHGDKRSGGVHNGTLIVLWGWNEGDNQKWKISPYCKLLARINLFENELQRPC